MNNFKKNMLSCLLALTVFGVLANDDTSEKLAPPPLKADGTEANSEENLTFNEQKFLEILSKIKPVDYDEDTLKQIAETQNITLTPEMILALRTLLARQEQAFNAPVKDIVLNVASERLNLSSIQIPIRLNVKRGFDTFVEFYDLTGTPWPVEKFISIGATEQFTAQALADLSENVQSNIVRVNAVSNLGDTTMTVQLKGVKETVNFRLIHNQLDSNADYKRVFTVPLVNTELANALPATAQVGDQPATPTQQRTNEFLRAANESFEPFFTGDVPAGAIEIPVLDGDAYAWMYQGFLYVKSRIEIITFPTSQHGVQSFSGWYVHKMSPYPQVSYYKDSKNLTIVLDDDALMSAANQQKIMMEQQEYTKMSLEALGG